MHRVIALTLVLATVAVPAAAQHTTADPQAFFKATLLADKGTSPAIRTMLRTGTGFVEPAPAFADVTGDGKSDALVRVMTGGAAGAIAVYALSTDGSTSTKLRVVFRAQRLFRATVKVNAAHRLVIRTPIYQAGDELCCASRARDRGYAWSATDKALHRVSSFEFPIG